MSGVADHAYSHCLAVLGDPTSAAEAAAIAVRHGGRARWAVLAHARHQALLREPAPPSDAATAGDLTELARSLAAARPASERALLDLADRHDLDRASLARAWGASPADVATQVAAIAEEWSSALDPVLLAWLGPGDCDALRTILAASELEVMPRVRAHAAACETCRDRMRAMVSVRTVLGTMALERAPDSVHATSRRRRRPLPPPAAPTARPKRPLWIAGVGAAAIVIVAVAVLASRERAPDRVEALTAAPPPESALVVDPNHVAGATAASVVLTNRSARELSWTAAAKEWIVLRPAGGRLGSAEQATIHIALAPTAPEGDVRATVTFSGDDGSSVALQFEAVIERPPDVDARVDACTVTAAVEDETRVAAVHLRWQAEETHERLMVERDEVWTAVLPSGAEPLAWWVTAVDARGNRAATVTEHVEPFCAGT